MQTTAETSTPTRKRKIRVIWIVLLLPVLLLVLLASAFMWQQMSLDRQIAAELQAARDRGEPVTPDELAAVYAVPADAVDRTDEWLRVLQQVKVAAENPAYKDLPIIGMGDDATIPAVGDPWADEPTIAQLMSELEPTFLKLQDLSENPGEVRFPRDFSRGFAMLLPNVQELRQLARVLALRAKWQVYQGDAQGALESLIAMRRTADTAEHDPILVSQLVRVAINGIASSYTLELMPHANWSDAQLAQLQQEFLNEADLTAIKKRAFQGERVIGNLIFEHPESMEGMGEEMPPIYLTRRSDQLFYLQLYARMIAASELPYEESRAEFEAIATELQEQTTLERLQHPLTSMVLPATSAFNTALVRGSVTSRATGTLIACQRFREKNGNWPTKLADLTPEFLKSVPLDPMDGKPLRYRVTATEVLVYSVGENLVDDGGPVPAETSGHDPDYVFKLQIVK